jgi:PilZ domain
MEGRKEKRNLQRLPVLLSSVAHPLLAEQVSTEDVTSYGMRVETGRPWELGSIVLLKSPQGELLARARVVYCKAMEPRAFSLGLEFVTRTASLVPR